MYSNKIGLSWKPGVIIVEKAIDTDPEKTLNTGEMLDSEKEIKPNWQNPSVNYIYSNIMITCTYCFQNSLSIGKQTIEQYPSIDVANLSLGEYPQQLLQTADGITVCWRAIVCENSECGVSYKQFAYWDRESLSWKF